MKKSYMCFLLMIFVAGIIGTKLIGTIHSEPVKAGEDAIVYVNLKNPLAHDFHDMTIKAITLDFYSFDLAHGFRIDDYETATAKLLLHIPKTVEKDSYLVRISATSADFQDSRYVYINVI